MDLGGHLTHSEPIRSSHTSSDLDRPNPGSLNEAGRKDTLQQLQVAQGLVKQRKPSLWRKKGIKAASKVQRTAASISPGLQVPPPRS